MGAMSGALAKALLLASLSLAPLLVSGALLTVEDGAGPLYKGLDLPFYLAPLPDSNVTFNDGQAARGWLMVPNRSNSSGAVCARTLDNPPLTALVVCRTLGWRGVARAAGANAPENSTAIGDGGVAWESLSCNGTEQGPKACDFVPVEANFTGCLPRARLVIECYQDPGVEGQLRFGEPPPAASGISDLYGRGSTVEVFHDGFWGYPAGPFSPETAVVLCRQAGYTAGTAGSGDMMLAGLGYREIGRAPALSRLRCNGTEETLKECRFRNVPPLPYTPYFSFLPRSESVSYYNGPLLPLLFCPDALNDTSATDSQDDADFSVRLAPSGDEAATAPEAEGCVSGDAQIRVDGYWGLLTVGDYGTGAEAAAEEMAQANAEVICRELGAPTANVTGRAYTPQPQVRLPVWVRDLECIGDETSVLDCGFSSNVVPGGSPPVPDGEVVYNLAVSCCP